MKNPNNKNLILLCYIVVTICAVAILMLIGTLIIDGAEGRVYKIIFLVLFFAIIAAMAACIVLLELKDKRAAEEAREEIEENGEVGEGNKDGEVGEDAPAEETDDKKEEK